MITATAWLLLLQSIVILIVAFTGVPLLSWYPIETRSAIQLYLCSAPASLLLIYLTCVCLGTGSTSMFNAMKIITALPPFISAAATYLVGPTLRTLLIWLMASSYVIALAACYFVGKRAKLIPARLDGSTVLKSLLTFGLRSYGANLCVFANMRIDQLFLSFAVAPSILGNYSVAASYSLLTYPLAAAAANTAFARVAAADILEKSKHTWEMVVKGTVASAIGLLFLWLLSHFLIPALYGRNFEEAIRLSSLLLLAAFFLSANYILGDCLRGLNLPGSVSRAEAISAIITIVGLSIAVPHFGVWGAAWVSLSSYAITSMLLLATVVRTLAHRQYLPNQPELANAT